MTAQYRASWRIDSVTPPTPIRHCSSCGDSRRFRSSGKVRLNANGRLLDAWLIYRCETCDKTWNLPLAERVAVRLLARAQLEAMQQSDPAWVRRQELNMALLRRHCDRIDQDAGWTLTRNAQAGPPGDWSMIELTIATSLPTGPRLDRLLSAELGLSRAELKQMCVTGGLRIGATSAKVLRSMISGKVALRFVAAQLTANQRATLTRSLAAGGRQQRS